jgi:predicted AlkP superfamily phosphohydrolase/phosphomutase
LGHRSRVLIIGLDGATFDLIGPWARAGYLPALAKLMAQGAHGPLRAWPNLNSAVAWTSMVTGYNPGQHGIYDFGDAVPQRDHKWHPVTAADRAQDPFWRLLSTAGQHVGIINVPISYPADSVEGFMLSGMDAPGDYSPGFAHPPDLLDELRHQGIDYILEVSSLGVASHRAPHRLPRSVQHMVDARARTVLHLMKNRPWDVLMAVFVATDRVQHFFWPTGAVSPEHDDWAPIRQLYQQIDAHLARMLEHIDGNTTVLIVSDHGFGPVRSIHRCLNPLFARLGLLHYSRGSGRVRGKLLRTLLLNGRRIIPQRLQLPLAQAFPGLHLLALSEYRYAGVEWSQTQVFATFGAIHVNLRGRQPEGIVAPEDYHPLRERVRDILLDLTDPTNDRHLVRAVHRREDVYHGPFLERAPDLLIEWEGETAQDALSYRVRGKPVVVQAPKQVGARKRLPGEHRSQGILIAWGPDIKSGATVAGATLYDVAPTILHLQGQPIPRDMDGKVLTDLFAEGYLRRRPVQYSEPSEVAVQTIGTVLDAEEARKIEERLRGLGYIE